MNFLITSMSRNRFEKLVKDKVEKAALKYLISKKNMHSKVKDLSYQRLESQEYIKSGLFSNDELEMLFSMISKMIKVTCNFPGLFNDKNNDEKKYSENFTMQG